MCSLKCDQCAKAGYFVTKLLKLLSTYLIVEFHQKCAFLSVSNAFKQAIYDTKLRMLICLYFKSESHRNLCAALSVSIVLMPAFCVTRQLHPPYIAECYYCTKKCAASSVSNELMLISGKAKWCNWLTLLC